MAFAPLVQIDTKAAPKTSAKVLAGLGCDACPSQKLWKKGVKPVKGKVRGKKLFIFAQSPNHDETKEQKELIGKSGQWLWAEMKKVGLRRKDCDIQNAVRCMPTDGKDQNGRWINKPPTKEAIACCSKYTERALAKSKAKVFIIFGEVAAKQVCGREFKKGQKIFWSEKLKAKVYCLDHPAYFLRGGSNKRLTAFRVSLAAAAAEVTGKSKGDPRYAALEKQDYEYITTIADAHAEARLIRRAAKKGIRVVFDSEEDFLDEYGKRMPLVMGTCFKPGRARIFALYHPDIQMKKRVRQEMLHIVAELLNDKHVKKVAHHGVSDGEAARKLYEVRLRGFDFDTEYSSFFANPARKAFGLKNVTDEEFPEFSGYASIIIPYAIPTLPEDADEEYKKLILGVSKKQATEQYQWYRARGLLRYSQVPAYQLKLYNGADCDISKRLEIRTKNAAPLPLMHVYMDAAWVLHHMERNGPVFDFEHHRKLRKIYPPRLRSVEKQIAKIAGKNFNPGSPQQIFNYVYNVLKLEYPFPLKRGEKINTQKAPMEFLGRTNKFCFLISQFRKLSKIVSTYLDSFEKCAIDNDGRLRTKWWLTGTQTGRLSSGGTKNESADTVINLQNVHGDPSLQNQAVPDKAWRKAFLYAADKMKRVVGTSLIRKLKKYANNPKKLYDQRDDKTGKVTWTGLISRIKAKLKTGTWKKYTRRILKRFGDVRVFLGFDFGQIEVRLLAQISGDKNLIADCKGGDIHSLVGHAMTGWAIEKIKKDKKTRTLTKNIHFGIMYGLNVSGVYNFIKAKDPDIKVTLEDVQRYYDAYFRRYPGVRKLTEKLRGMAESKGYVENMFGFRRPLNTSEEAEEGDTGAYWGNQAINCVDFKTEILTQRGWLKGTKLKTGDVALTKNAESGKLEWQTVQDVKVYPDYEQPLVKFSSKSFSAASTLDHRWLVKNGSCKTTADLLQNKWQHLPRTGEYDGPGGSSYPDDIVRLAGWYLTDGYSRKQGGGHGFALCQSSIPEKVKMIDELAKRLKDNYGFHVRTQSPKNRKEGEIFWHFSGGLASFFAGKFPKRTLTPQFLTELTAPQLEILLHTMILGDGWGSKLSKLKRKTKIGFCTGRKKQADVFQILCMLTGRACAVKKRDVSKYAGKDGRPKNMTFIWNCNVLRRKFVDVAYLKSTLIKNKGVWCPVVPNTYFVARRKGQPFITGNTPIQGAAHQLMLMAIAALKRFKKKYLPILGIPTLEVHDAIYFFVSLKNILKAFVLGKELLEKEPLKIIEKEYPDIQWHMPMVVEGKAGFRLGDTIEAENMTIEEALSTMVLETLIKEYVLDIELKKAA